MNLPDILEVTDEQKQSVSIQSCPEAESHNDPLRTRKLAVAAGGYSVLNGSKGTLYRGRWGMWSWVAHRITGIAIFFFLLVHILDTAVVRISPEAYNGVLSLYKNPIMGLGETALVAAIVYHAFNGIRIILIDFWGKATNSHVEHIQAKNKDGNVEISQKATYTHIKILWVVLFLWAITVAGFAARHLPIVFSHMGGH